MKAKARTKFEESECNNATATYIREATLVREVRDVAIEALNARHEVERLEIERAYHFAIDVATTRRVHAMAKAYRCRKLRVCNCGACPFD